MKYFAATICLLGLGLVSGRSTGENSAIEDKMTMIPLGKFESIVNGKAEEFYWFTTSIKLIGDNANKICESTIGGKAVSLEYEVKNIAAKRFLASHDITEVWTGGNDFKKNGQFIWESTECEPIPFTYTDWSNDNLFPNPNCQCVSMEVIKYPNSTCGNDCLGEYKWRERPCAEKKFLLCEL